MTVERNDGLVDSVARQTGLPELGTMLSLVDRVGPTGLIHVLEPLPWAQNERLYFVELPEAGASGGRHAHKALKQLFVAFSGRVRIRVKTPVAEVTHDLEPMKNALYLGPGVWREYIALEGAATLLVVASNMYDENDYIRDWTDYCSWFHQRSSCAIGSDENANPDVLRR